MKKSQEKSDKSFNTIILIVTVLVIETDMAIMTALAIKRKINSKVIQSESSIKSYPFQSHQSKVINQK